MYLLYQIEPIIILRILRFLEDLNQPREPNAPDLSVFRSNQTHKNRKKRKEPNYVIVLSLTARLCHHITPTNNSLFLFLLFYHRHHHHHHYQRCLQRSTHLRYRSRNGGQWQNNSDETTERTRSTASTPTLRH